MTAANTNQPLQLVLTTEASAERARALACELLIVQKVF